MSMKFLLDKNLLTKELKLNASNRDDLCVIQDVLDEGPFTEADIKTIKSAGVKVLRVAKKHLEKLKDVLSTHGENFKLINLYTGKGTADVMMIAFILAERDNPDTLFSDEYTIVTNDKELISVAKSYEINSASELN